MRTNKILVIGYFGASNGILGGQHIKTRTIYRLLINKLPNSDVHYWDADNLKTHPFPSLLQLLICPFKYNKIVYLPGQNNLSHFFPILYQLSKLTKSEIIYPVVGGWLPDYIKDKIRLRKYLKKIKSILVESTRMRVQMCNMGFKNVEVLSNFRITDFKPNIKYPQKTKFVFMARICREKGCDLIFEAISKLNNSFQYDMDFYGPVSKDYLSDFYKHINKFENVSYHGQVNPEDVFKTLSNYDCLLLPTYYEGEGFPGSIVDAFISGIPTIVSDWKDLSSFIENAKTGFVIPVKDSNSLAKKMCILISNSDLLYSMKKNVHADSYMFGEEYAWEIIKRYVM